jgi:hypothetical protein
MKKAILTVLVPLFAVAGAVHAQQSEGIRESTDPAKVAEVERRAQEIMQAGQQDASRQSASDTRKSKRSDAQRRTSRSGGDMTTSGGGAGSGSGTGAGAGQGSGSK